jgi:hypothetical protein
MATDQHPQSGRRQHFHRGRRGHDRRGDRRPAPAQQSQEPAQPEQADVDQIVKNIKARISQRHGIDLSSQQIQELAARRLEAILDPRTVKPGLLDQLRRAAGAPADIAPPEPADAYTFEDHTIYDTHNGVLRFLRRLLAPLLKLFFNPNPIAAALNAQVKVNREAARREAEHERTQAEWNALHYTVLQRLVTEVSRVSLEMQSLALRVESLSTRADYAERRIRSIEAPPAAPAPPARSFDVPPPASQPSPSPRPSGEGVATDGQGSEGRRRRRRRRGRRSNVPGGDTAVAGTAIAATAGDATDADEDTFDDGPEGEGADADDAQPEEAGAVPVATAPEAGAAPEIAAPAPAPAAWNEPSPADTAPDPAESAAMVERPAEPAAASSPEPAAPTADAPPPATDSTPNT